MTNDLTFLLNHLWQSTLIAGLAWLACATVFKRKDASLRSATWLAASLKFLLPFGLLVEAGRQRALPRLINPIQSNQVFDVVTIPERVLAPAGPSSARVPAPHVPTDDPNLLVVALLIVWAAGAALVLSRWMRHWWTIRRIVREAEPAGHFRGVPLLRSHRMRDQRLEPGVFGLWRQSILIPADIEDRLTAPQLNAVLEHEWHHARRRDNLAAFVHLVVQAVFWFHPVVWLVGRRLIQEREMACDQAVLATTAPEPYAEGILSVCKFYCAHSHNLATGVTSANLRTRVESILKNERPPTLGPIGRWMVRTAVVATIITPALVGWLTAQAVVAQQDNSFVGLTTTANRKFEVASIKRNVSGETEGVIQAPRNGVMTIVNIPLAGIIAQSFRTNRTMMSGGPDWIGDVRYDIVAKSADPNSTSPELWEMMRSMLIERFHLKYHVENREMPIFALTVARGGHKLTPGDKGECAEALKTGQNCSSIIPPPWGAGIRNMPIGALITTIGRRAGRPIVDRTGLTGRYDVTISWVPDGVKFEEVDPEAVPPQFRPLQDMSLAEALEKQAGLKLEPERASQPFLIVDSVTEPDSN